MHAHPERVQRDLGLGEVVHDGVRQMHIETRVLALLLLDCEKNRKMQIPYWHADMHMNV